MIRERCSFFELVGLLFWWGLEEKCRLLILLADERREFEPRNIYKGQTSRVDDGCDASRGT